LLRNENVLAVASPAVAAKIMAASDLSAALASEPLLAYNLELPLIDHWLAKNHIKMQQILPAMIGQDLRTLCTPLSQGFGWTVLPEYLCRACIARGELMEITAPVGVVTLGYYLVWAPSALRQPRIAHARQTLLWQLKKP
jgi:DNA-binding transcriptional LysR family regulator